MVSDALSGQVSKQFPREHFKMTNHQSKLESAKADDGGNQQQNIW